MVIICIILVIVLFFAYDSYFSFPVNINYQKGIDLNSVSKFSIFGIMLLIIPYLSIADSITKLLNFYPITSICMFFIPLFILAATICFILYKTFDKPYLAKGSEKEPLFKLLFTLNIILTSSIFSIGTCNLLNYYFAKNYTIKYVAVKSIDKEHHHTRHGGFYTCNAVLKEPLLDTKTIFLDKYDPGDVNDKYMKIKVYNGALGIPFVTTKNTEFVDKQQVPSEFITNSKDLQKELDANRGKSEFLEKGMGKNVPLNGY